MTHMPLFETAQPKALTVQQPWAFLITSGRKPIENRSWQTQYRGPLYIHAGKRMHSMPMPEIERIFDLTIDPALLEFGAIIGRVELVNIVARSTSPWFSGPYGWILEKPEPCLPIPLRGQMGLFDLPQTITRQFSSRR